MELQHIQNIALALHGPAFHELTDDLSSGWRALTHAPSVGAEPSPEVHKLVSEVFEIAHTYLAECSADREINREHRHAQLKICDDSLQSVSERVKSLDDYAVAVFEKKLTQSTLEALENNLSGIPRFSDLCKSESPRDTLIEMRDSILKQLRYLKVLQELGVKLGDKAYYIPIVGQNLEHDALGHYGLVRDELTWNSRVPDWNVNSSKWLPRVLDVEVPFIQQVVAGTRAIAVGDFRISPTDPHTMLITSAAPNAMRYGYSITVNGAHVCGDTSDEQQIRITTTPDMSLYIDSGAIGLVLYNLIKNPIKLAKFSMKPLPSVDIEVTPSSDGRCYSLFVRDDGIGLSYDKLRSVFSDRARARRDAGTPLPLVDQCLLDEFWSNHVPPVALHQLLLDRGASVGGGTGIGLAMAHSIVSGGHQGYLELYNHPKHGAGVQILLPNVGTEISPEERRRITHSSLQHQLAHRPDVIGIG